MKRIIELNLVKLRGRSVMAAGKVEVEVPRISAITFAANHSIVFVDDKPFRVRELEDEIRTKMFGSKIFASTV